MGELGHNISEDVREETPVAINLLKRMIPLLVLLILAVGLWIFFNKGCGTEPISEVKPVISAPVVHSVADTSIVDTSSVAVSH